MSTIPRLASSHSDHRRGVVLGLTMAEVLILLLFILMLALLRAIQLRESQFKDILAVLLPPAGSITESIAADLKAQISQLKKDSEALKTRSQEMLDLQAAALKLDPNAPPAATLRQAIADSIKQRRAKSLQTSMDQMERLEIKAKRVNPSDPPAATLDRGLDQLETLYEARRTDPDSLMANPQDVRAINTSARELAREAKPVDTISSALSQVANAQSGSASKPSTTVKDIVVAVRDKERKLGARLRQEFEGDLETWKANLDESGLSLRFENPDLLFEAGKADLRPEFQRFLDDFFPRYIAKVAEFKDDIEEVRIEGHTSSEWRGTSDEMETYFNNMKLSQDRTRAVLAYGMKTGIDPVMQDWGRSTITANGLASSRLKRLSDGREDRAGSRRVEFKVLMKLHEGVMKVIDDPGVAPVNGDN